MPKWLRIVNILGVISDDKCLIPFKPIAVSKFSSVVLKNNLVMKEN
jgi:hypothetical protein